jgi:hypothetical protein
LFFDFSAEEEEERVMSGGQWKPRSLLNDQKLENFPESEHKPQPGATVAWAPPLQNWNAWRFVWGLGVYGDKKVCVVSDKKMSSDNKVFSDKSLVIIKSIKYRNFLIRVPDPQKFLIRVPDQ